MTREKKRIENYGMYSGLLRLVILYLSALRTYFRCTIS